MIRRVFEETLTMKSNRRKNIFFYLLASISGGCDAYSGVGLGVKMKS